MKIAIEEVRELNRFAQSGNAGEAALQQMAAELSDGRERYRLARVVGRIWRIHKSLGKAGSPEREAALEGEMQKLIGELVGFVGFKMADQFLTEIANE